MAWSSQSSVSLESAILAVFSGTGASAAESNEFLLSFIETEKAWGEALALFESPVVPVRYFAANIVYNKSKRHVSQLGGDQKERLCQVLLGSLRGQHPQIGGDGIAGIESSDMAAHKPFLNRVMLTLACVCCHLPGNGIQQYVHAAIAKITQSPSVQSEFDALLGLEMLYVILPEVEALDVSHSVREELQAQLLQMSDIVLKTIDAIAVSNSKFCGNSVKLGALKALRSWLLVAIISPSKMQKEHEPSWRLVYESFQSGNVQCIREGCSFVREIIKIEDYPRSEARDLAIMNLVNMIISSMPNIVPIFQQAGDDADELKHDICDCLVSVASQEVRLLVNPSTFNVKPFELLLMFAATKPRKIATLTFDVWLALQEIPVAERHIFMSQEVFYKLLEILFDQITFPLGPLDQETEEEEKEDLESFRDLKFGSLHEVVLVCFYALQNIFFTTLGERLTVFSASPLDKWPILESVLFLLHISMDSIKSVMKSEQGGTGSMQFILSTLHLVLHLPHLILPNKCELQNTICKFIGSLTFLLTADPKNSPHLAPFAALFVPALEYVFCALQNPVASKSASKAFYQLCIHGQRILSGTVLPATIEGANFSATHASDLSSSNTPLICKLVAASAQLIADPISVTDDESALSSIIECIVRGIVILPFSLAHSLVNELTTPILDGLNRELQSTALNIDRVCNLLVFSGQIIRFCGDVEQPEGATQLDSSKHILCNFLSNLWPQVQALEMSSHFHQSGPLSSKIFDLYGRAFMSACLVVKADSPRVLQTVVSVVQNQGEGSVAGLHCCKCLVEALSGKQLAGSHDLILVQLLQYLSQILISLVQSKQPSQHLGFLEASSPRPVTVSDPEVLDAFFNLVFTFITVCPNLLASSSLALSQILQLCVATLGTSRERGTVRAVLQVIQPFFSAPPTLISKLQPFKLTFLAEACLVGPHLTKILIEFVSGGSIDSTLRHSVVDTIYYIIVGCEPTNGGDARMWIKMAAFSPEMFTMLSPELKQFVVSAMFSLATSNHRRFKALMIDLCKICCSEQPIDSLGAFSDAALG